MQGMVASNQRVSLYECTVQYYHCNSDVFWPGDWRSHNYMHADMIYPTNAESAHRPRLGQSLYNHVFHEQRISSAASGHTV